MLKRVMKKMLNSIGNFVEKYLRIFVVWLTNFLPVKVIRDERGTPFLYRYHLFTSGYDGPGMCFHRFVKSDPDRGYHDHPWSSALSFILAGGYEERILNEDKLTYRTFQRNRWTFNYLDGEKSFHRVMIEEGKDEDKNLKDCWTLFAFKKRSKIWGMVDLSGSYYPMSKTVEDNDGGWWNTVDKGYSIENRVEKTGVVSTVDIIVLYEDKVLLIKRGKEPFKGEWAFPGGRIEKDDEDILAAARRELKEETNIEWAVLNYVKTIGNRNRDPRGFCLTNVFHVNLPFLPSIKAGDDAVDYQLFPITNLPAMAFDHKQILEEFLSN